LIENAEVLVYDYLVHPELVEWCRPGCEVVYVGKKAGFHALPQDEIEALLAALFASHKPEVIGNDYLIVGTLERSAWKRGCQTPLMVPEMLENLHDFKDALLFEPVHYGWVKDT